MAKDDNTFNPPNIGNSSIGPISDVLCHKWAIGTIRPLTWHDNVGTPMVGNGSKKGFLQMKWQQCDRLEECNYSDEFLDGKTTWNARVPKWKDASLFQPQLGSYVQVYYGQPVVIVCEYKDGFDVIPLNKYNEETTTTMEIWTVTKDQVSFLENRYIRQDGRDGALYGVVKVDIDGVEELQNDCIRPPLHVIKFIKKCLNWAALSTKNITPPTKLNYESESDRDSEDAIMLDTYTNTNNDDDDNSNGTTMMMMDTSDNDDIVNDTTKDTTMVFALPPSNHQTQASIVFASSDSHHSHHEASELLRSAFLQPTDETFPGQGVGKEDSTCHLRPFGNESCVNNLYNSTDDYSRQPRVSTTNDNVNVDDVGVIGDRLTLRKATNDLESIMDDDKEEEEEEVLSMMEVEGGDDMAGASDDGSVASSSTIVDYYYSIFGDKATVTEEECANYLRDKAKELKLIQTKLNQIGKGRLYQHPMETLESK